MASPSAGEPRTRGYKKKERTRRQLVAAAIDVIAERGESFTVNDVTNRAGLSNGTFYNYFDDRNELIDAVVPEVIRAFAVASATTVAEDDPAIRFATITALALRRAAASPDEIRVMLRLEAVQQTIVDAPALDPLRADLRDGVTTGRFAVGPDGPIIDVIVGGLLVAARRIVDDGADDAYAAGVVAHLLRSLGVDDAEARELAAEAVAATLSIDDAGTSWEPASDTSSVVNEPSTHL